MRHGFAALLLALTLAACGGSGDDQDEAASSPSAAAEQLTDVGNVLDLRAAFNEGDGRPRLILFLSPT